MGIFEDITERKLVEEALKRSELTYREIFESVNDAIFVHDADSGRILDVNRKMCEMYSYTYEEALMVEVGDLSDPDCYLFSKRRSI
jgi:PAS domain S-box-containing protein